MSIIILVIMVLTGCKQIILWKYGIHAPREETPESIRKFLASHDFTNENIFIFRDSTVWAEYLRDTVSRSNMLGTLFYSPQGLLDNFIDTSKCQWSGGYHISTFKKDTVYHVDTTHSFVNLMARLMPLSRETVLDTANADYYAVVTWGTFLGKYNERLFIIREGSDEQKEVTVKAVFINIDMLKEWNLTDKQGLSFSND